jgi:hypothetical protein
VQKRQGGGGGGGSGGASAMADHSVIPPTALQCFPIVRHSRARSPGIGPSLASTDVESPATSLQLQLDSASSRASTQKGDASASVRLSARVLRFMYYSQLLSVVVLTILVGGLLYFAWRVQSNVNYYYYYAQPYLDEAKDHGTSIMRNADASSQSLSRVMAAGEDLAADSVPGLVSSVQNATRLMARASELAAHPVIKLSLGE